MNSEQLKAICDLTIKLTELRLKDCAHLCIENFAPELFAQLIGEFHLAENGTYKASGDMVSIIGIDD
jgi:hypothetical protein